MARDPWHKKVKPNLPDLRKNIRPVSSGLLDELYAHQVINRSDFTALTSLDTEETRARDLLEDKLPLKGPESFDKLCDQLSRCGGYERVLKQLRGAASNVFVEAWRAEKDEEARKALDGARGETISDDGARAETAADDASDYESLRLVVPVPATESVVRFGKWMGVQPKRVSFYIPPDCQNDFQAIEEKVMLACTAAGISNGNVQMIYESVDEESGEVLVKLQSPQEGARAVVCDKVMLTSFLLHCEPASEFRIDRDALIATLSNHLNISDEDVAVKEILDDSKVIVSLPLQGVAALFDVFTNAKKGFALAVELKSQVDKLSHVEVQIGCLHLPLPLIPPVEAPEELAEDAFLVKTPDEHLQHVLACRFSGDDNAKAVEAACIKLTEMDSKDSKEAMPWKNKYLFYAAGAGQVEMCDVLLQQEADPRAFVQRGNRQLSAIHVAAQGDHVDVIKSLLKLEEAAEEDAAGRGPARDDTVTEESGMSEAVEEEAARVGAKEQATRREIVNLCGTRDKNTPLHWASWYGNYNTVELLLQQQADLNVVNGSGCAPLHYAAASGSAKCIKLLTDAEADKEVRTTTLNLTPLDVAIQEHQVDAVQSLLDAKVNPTLTTKHCLQPIHFAASLGDHRCLRLLIREGVGCRDGSLFGNSMDLAKKAGHLIEVIDTVTEAMEDREINKASKVKDLEDKLKNISQDVELLNGRCTTLTNDSKKLEEEVKKLSDDLKEQEKEAEENQQKAKELEEKLTKEQDQLTTQVEAEKKKFEELSEEVTKFKQEHDDLEQKIKLLEQTAIVMQDDISKLEQTVGTEDPTEASESTLAEATALDKPLGTERDTAETTGRPQAAAAAASVEALAEDSP